MTEEEVFEKYKISDEKIKELTQQSIQLATFGKTPVKNPICVLVGGQSGAGKSGLIAHSKKMFPDGNVITIEDDDERPFYPNEKELAQLHPDLYYKVTDIYTQPAVREKFEYLIKKGYNVVFHQTFGGQRIADDGIVKLIEAGYSIVVNALAVSGEKSLHSMILRGLGQIEYKGHYRPVTTRDHDRTFNGMPNTLDYIEKMGRFDVIQVFKRGEEPNNPVMVYSKTNLERPEHVENIASHPSVCAEDNSNGFESAYQAVIETRAEDRAEFVKQYPDKRDEMLNNPYVTPELAEQMAVLDQRAEFNPNQSATPAGQTDLSE